jgi:hypothetical protein
VLGTLARPAVVVFVLVYVTNKYKDQLKKMFDSRLESVEALGIKVLWAARQALESPVGESVVVTGKAGAVHIGAGDGHVRAESDEPYDTLDDIPAVHDPASDEEMARQEAWYRRQLDARLRREEEAQEINELIVRAVEDQSLGAEARATLLAEAQNRRR